MRFPVRALSFLVMTSLTAGAALAQKGETVKIAWIDPLSGLMARVAQNQLKSYQFVSKNLNAGTPAGVKFEIISIDNKLSPAESLNALKSAVDQGVRYVVQGLGSGAAGALVDAINKHNERNPGKEVVFLNYAAVDPDLTNSKCSFWHFRLDADTSMKMEAMTTFMKDQKEIQKVYLINQNYAHGQQVSKYAKENLKRKRPDVQVVGDDLHPLAQVRDFAPYVAKIKASGADTVITGNWGSDLAGVAGQLTSEFKKRFNDDYYSQATYSALVMLAQGMANAKSTDPVKVAHAMEGLNFKSFNGEVEMRKSDHQLQQPLFIARWAPLDAKNTYDVEKTGMTFVPVKAFDSYVSSTPTSCQMKRPS